jgi:serine/threonine protein kinase
VGVSAGTGAVLGDYIVGLPIGGGKFGTVCHAIHGPTGRAVALKLIRLEQADSEEKVVAEQRGAALQQQFSEVHRELVPQVYEHGTMGAYYGIAMEYVPGMPLIHLIARGPLPPARAAEIALALARFLDKAHRFRPSVEGLEDKRIVHGDLKPEHVLILDGDQIRVLDFGIAKALEGQSPATTNKWLSIAYASPERLQSDGHVNEHADFWAVGVMLFEMVAGYRPHWRLEHSLSRLDRAIRTYEPPEPMPPDSDSVLVAIVRKLLAPQVERRYQTATDLIRDLDAYRIGIPTMAAAEHASASEETIPVRPGGPPPVSSAEPVPTEPVPRPSTKPAASAASALPKPARASLPAAPVSRNRRAGRLVAACLVLTLGGSEVLGMLRAERLRDQIWSIEPADLPAVRTEYERIVEASPFGLAIPLRINGPLTNRLVDLANRTIYDFRNEAPTVAEAQWRQALDCLELARELSPNDRTVSAKRAYVEGHLVRIAAGDESDRDRAIRAFRESARLDPRQPDPYLGLARVAAYWTRDAEALAQAIAEAEERGYMPGRREQAQFGDLRRALGDRAYTAGMRADGDERVEDLELAKQHYEKCVEYFNGLNFFDSESNLRACRRRGETIDDELERLRPGLRLLDFIPLPLF